jgi:outer membrane protein TolC
MNNKKTGITLVLTVLLTILSGSFTEIFAQTEKTDLIDDLELTLDEAIQVAIANNPQVKRALLSVDDADELVRIAYSEVFPDISSSVNYTRNIELPVSYLPGEFFGGAPGTLVPVSFGTDNNWQGGFTVTQTLFRGETIIGLSTSEIYKAVQKENLRSTTQQIITQARVAYYQVLVANEQLRLQESQIERLEHNLRENKARQEAGIVDAYSVLQLEVQLSNQRPQLIEAKYGVDEAYRNLKVALGLPLQFEFEVVGSLNEFDILSDEATSDVNAEIKSVDRMNTFTFQKQGLDSLGLEATRGDLRLLNASLDLKDREVTAVKSRFLPTLSATYNLAWSAAEPGTPNFFQNPEPNTDPNRFQTLGINLSLPIFQGFKRMADVQRVKIERKDLEEQKRAAQLMAQNEVASASEAINKVFETAEARKLALEQANEGYVRAQKRLENGLGSQIEVTDAEVQVRQAEVNYALMVFEYLTAKAQYDLATGKVPYVDTSLEN